MKKFIAKWLLGIDIEGTVARLNNLTTTLTSLEARITDTHELYEKTYLIAKGFRMSDEDEPWYMQDDVLRKSNHDIYRHAQQIRKSIEVENIKAFPSIKTPKIFHGGCVGCISIPEHGQGRCLGCQYLTANWNLPDLSIKQ